MTLRLIEYTSLSDDDIASIKTQDNKVHLFNNLVCPFGHRALWTAAEVDVPFEMINVDLVDMPESYVTHFNRYHTVPCLVDNGYTVYESAIVAQFLDAKYNAGRLYNRDDPERAALAQLAVVKFVASPLYALLHNHDESKMNSKTTSANRWHAAPYRSKGPYLLGDQLSSAELNIVTFLFRFKYILQHYRNFEILDGVPLLTAAMEAATARPAFQNTAKDPDFYIRGFAHHANE
ncbi:glutathione transferase family protein [Achlya hypogyna]|uniref:Glutathione transferase family protein n=1 Tax=Achlya hypogyna TaxID=1202772 RepID=A0A1V9YU91_ACHHY|nr:glutathione transferase family protein [Achlya hypogyna]